jgi:CRP-like cAMP-binding protein
VEELRSEERKFREQMDKFNVYMRANNMPLPLQDSIREYLKNVKRVQSERLSMEQEIELISQVSYGIKEDIAEKVSAELIKAMPFFECEDPMVIMELSFNMERSFMGPDEEVIRFGDIGEEMYFILDGKVEVVLNTRGREEKKSVANLEKGDFFGEMALLQPNHVRTATVKTVTFCEFRCLTAELFRILSFNYPQFGRSLKSIVGARKKQHQEAGGRGVHRPMTKSSSFNLSRDDEPKIIVSSSFSIDKEPDDMKTPSKEAAEVSPPSRAESRVPGEPSETQLMQSIKAKMLEMSEMQKATINQIRAF